MPLSHRSGPILWLLIALMGTAFFLIEHNLSISREDFYGTAVENLESSAAEGHRFSQVGISLLALVGVGCLLRKTARPWAINWPLVALIIVFVAWCSASAAWSIDRSLTIKRVGILIFCLIGAAGMARRLTVRDICFIAIAIPLAYIVMGIGVELSLGTFHPLSSDYRFAGTIHPNGQGSACAILCMACVLLLKSSKRKGWLIALLVLGLTCLLLTKSRTACGAHSWSLSRLSRSLGCRSRVILTGALVALGSAAFLALIVECVGPQYWQELKDAAWLGRREETEMLNGRSELWDEVTAYAHKRPLAGFGYRSFWTPEAHRGNFRRPILGPQLRALVLSGYGLKHWTHWGNRFTSYRRNMHDSRRAFAIGARVNPVTV